MQLELVGLSAEALARLFDGVAGVEHGELGPLRVECRALAGDLHVARPLVILDGAIEALFAVGDLLLGAQQIEVGLGHVDELLPAEPLEDPHRVGQLAFQLDQVLLGDVAGAAQQRHLEPQRDVAPL